MPNRIFPHCFFAMTILFCLSFLTAQESQVPDIEVQRLSDGKLVTLVRDNASIIFFFDASFKKRDSLLNEINRLAYAFRMRNLEVIGIYSDLEPEGPDEEEIEELKQMLGKMQEHLYFSLCIDLERMALSEFQVEKVPALFVCNGKTILYYQQEQLDYFTVKAWTEYALGFLTEEEREERLKRQQDSFVLDIETAAETVPLPDTEIADAGDDVPSAGDDDVTNIADDDAADTGSDNNGNITGVDSQSGDRVEKKSVLSKMQTKISPIVAAISIPENLGEAETIGYKPIRWQLSTSVDNAFFYTLTDMLINLIPLFIWGWGMLYCLGKMSAYRGMLWGLFGCFGLFLYSAWSLSCRIPFELCIVSPKLMYWKDLVVRAHYFLQGKDSWPNAWQFASFGYWQVKLVVVLLLQIALIKGIAGRLRDEREICAA